MKRKRVLAVTAALWLLAQMAISSSARAEEPSLAADVSAGVVSAIATIFALPVKLTACVTTVALGGAVYGLTMGTSEIIQQELVAGTNYTCGGKFYITPQEIKQFARDPERRR